MREREGYTVLLGNHALAKSRHLLGQVSPAWNIMRDLFVAMSYYTSRDNQTILSREFVR